MIAAARAHRIEDPERPNAAAARTFSNTCFSNASDIADAHMLGRPLKPSEIARFRARGVEQESLELPIPVLVDSVVFRNDGTFDFARDTEEDTATLAFTIVAQGIGGLTDIVAWEPRRNHVGLLLNRAFALGEEQIWAPGVSRDPIPVRRSLLNWLRAGRCGLFVLRPAVAPFYFRDVGEAVVEDVEHGEELEKMLRPTNPMTRIFVPIE